MEKTLLLLNMPSTLLKTIKSFFLLLLCCAFFLLLQKEASAQPFFSLTNSHITYNENILSLKLLFSLPRIEEVERLLTSGASLEINSSASLYKKNIIFSDTELNTSHSSWHLRYDSITREFILYKDKQVVQRSQILKNVLESLFVPLDIDIKDTSELKENENYYINVDVGLKHATVPTWIEAVLFFWTWEILDDTYIFNFTLSEIQ